MEEDAMIAVYEEAYANFLDASTTWTVKPVTPGQRAVNRLIRAMEAEVESIEDYFLGCA